MPTGAAVQTYNILLAENRRVGAGLIAVIDRHGPSLDRIREAYRHCEDLVRAHDKDHYLASLFAPADRRPYLFALYAFALEIGRVEMLVT